MLPFKQNSNCALCAQVGGELVWQNDDLRVIMVDEPHFVGFVRVVWQAHVAEMTDLSPAQHSQLMKTVCVVEEVLRQVLQPTKVNLASLGNMTPHLHWHVIPRFAHDVNFPHPVWAITPEQAAQKPQPCVSAAQYAALVQALKIALWSM
ncbi:MAG: HIT family protein [Formosimonas sp.]